MLIWRNEYAQLFGYNKSGHEHEHARMARGLGLKLNGRAFGRPTIRHVAIGVYGPVNRIARGAWTCEVSTWTTAAHGKGTRLTVKAFVRIKIGLGGRLPAWHERSMSSVEHERMGL